MKKIIIGAGLMLAITCGADAQTKRGVTISAAKNAKVVKAESHTQVSQLPQQLSNWGVYNARMGNQNVRQLTISDPTINTMNRRANGEQVPMNFRELTGVPKITYGIGNGQLLFRNRGATTSGTSTGNGLVGTGSGLGPVGINGLSLGVNGKSPFAGPIMDGIILTGLPASEAPAANRREKNNKKQ